MQSRHWRSRTTYPALLALAALATGACTHRYQVTQARMAEVIADDEGPTSGADFSRPSGPALVPLRYERRSHLRGMVDGLGVGFLTGAVLGVAIGLASGDDQACALLCFSAEEKAVFAGTTLGAVGGVTGVVLGGIQGSEMIYHRRHEADVDVHFATAGRTLSAGWSTEF